MLYIYFGQFDRDTCDDRYVFNIDDVFDHYYRDEWCTPIAKFLLERIDKTKFIYPKVVDSPVFGVMDVRRISGTVKCLIMIQAVQDLLYNGDNLGDDAWPYLLELSKHVDICINQTYAPFFNWIEGAKAKVLNSNRIIDNYGDFLDELIIHRENMGIESFIDEIDWPCKFNADILDDSDLLGW